MSPGSPKHEAPTTYTSPAVNPSRCSGWCALDRTGLRHFFTDGPEIHHGGSRGEPERGWEISRRIRRVVSCAVPRLILLNILEIGLVAAVFIEEIDLVTSESSCRPSRYGLYRRLRRRLACYAIYVPEYLLWMDTLHLHWMDLCANQYTDILGSLHSVSSALPPDDVGLRKRNILQESPFSPCLFLPNMQQ